MVGRATELGLALVAFVGIIYAFLPQDAKDAIHRFIASFKWADPSDKPKP